MITLYAPEPASVPLIGCSPPSWMVELALIEKGLEHEVRRLSFARGEHRTPEMLALNPRGTIPVLVDEGVAMHEALAMLEHIDDIAPDPTLLPRERASRARARDRLHESGALKAAGMQLFAYLMRTPEEARDAERVGVMIEAFDAELVLGEQALGQGDYLAGRALTLVDLAVFVYVATAVQLGWHLSESHPRLAGWYARMRQRGAVRASWPADWGAPLAVLAGGRARPT